MTPADVLRKARARIADPNNWTQHQAAVRPDPFGFGTRLKCHPDHPDACAWCLMGSIEVENLEQYEKVRAAIVATTGPYLAQFNDSHSHAEVLDVLDAAILHCEGGGPSLSTDRPGHLLGPAQGEAPVAP